ncbi:MAG: outer membrane protein assembly factor BamD [Wenzhouxiangella sp.]|nr:MAG: outer membrane protein assembly factor BamD [Wenzhouxiangella sp.]
MQNPFHPDRPLRAPLALLLILTLALAVGCGRETREDERGAEELYAEAQRALNARNFSNAIDLYRDLTIRFPFGRHAEQAQLDMAYAMYRANQPERALTTLDRFIRTYPTHPNVDYAWYLKGLVHYEQSMGFLRRLFPDQVVDRDQQSARNAFSDFQELIQRYPQSRYVADARQRMVFLRNIMAEYEVEVGRYYFRRGAYVASLNRARYTIENFPGAPANLDALDLMARTFKRMELPELAADTRQVLEYNFEDLLDEDERESFFRRLWPFD